MIKRTLLAVAVAVVAMATSLNAQVLIAGWDFTGENTVATSSAELVSPDLDAFSVLSRGAGAAASAGANSFRTQGFQNNGISVANTDYFEFSLSAASGFTMSLTSIQIRTSGTGTYAAAPGVSQQWAYSLDGINFTLIDVPVVVVGTGMQSTFDLSTTPALQNLSDGSTVTLRYYASGQTSTGGWGLFSNAAGDNGLAIFGTGVSAAIPEPATYMLFGIGLLACAQRFRRAKKKQ